MMTNNRTYEQLLSIPTFIERFHYLSLPGEVGELTFGHERYLNQKFYASAAWRDARYSVIVRDNGCDLGIPGRDIHGSIYIHHLNPLTPEDLKFGRPCLTDPNNLITVSRRTHNAIHYGDENQLQRDFVERTPGDTKDW